MQDQNVACRRTCARPSRNHASMRGDCKCRIDTHELNTHTYAYDNNMMCKAAFAVTPFLGDITLFSKPGRRFGNYVASLGRSFTVVNIVGSRPAFRVSSVVIRSVFTNGLSIQT